MHVQGEERPISGLMSKEITSPGCIYHQLGSLSIPVAAAADRRDCCSVKEKNESTWAAFYCQDGNGKIFAPGGLLLLGGSQKIHYKGGVPPVLESLISAYLSEFSFCCL